jgi:hypothetical protein
MNFLEFVSDHYVSLSLDHSFNGFLFNKIPLLRRLKWREAVAAKAVWGGIRAENDPARHPSLLRLPTDAAGQPTPLPSNRGRTWRAAWDCQPLQDLPHRPRPAVHLPGPPERAQVGPPRPLPPRLLGCRSIAAVITCVPQVKDESPTTYI